MKRLLLLLVLVTSVALAGKNPWAAKYGEQSERGIPTDRQFAAAHVMATWDTMAIYTADLTCNEIFPMGGGLIWVGGYVVSSGDDITMRSTDNGATWSTSTLTFTLTNGAQIAPRDANLCIAADALGHIYRTTNGGTTWDSVYYYGGGSGYFDGIKFVGGDTVIAVGDAFDATGFHVLMSIDAGATWTRFTNLPTAELDAGTYSNASYRQGMDIVGHTMMITVYWGSGILPQVLRTTDLGANWTTAEMNLTGGASNAYYARSINMVDENVAWVVPRQTASGTRCYVHKTTDGGTTWSDTILVDVKGNVVMSVKPERGTNNLLALGYLGNDARAWWSSDGGATWAGIHPAVVGDGGDLYNGAFVSPTLGYFVGDYRALIFTPPPVSVETKTGHVPTSYALDQNYPNPFNPSSVIRFELPGTAQVNLSVFDMLGRQISVLVNEKKEAGVHEVTFNGSGLASGMYMYRLQAGTYVETKKMILVK